MPVDPFQVTVNFNNQQQTVALIERYHIAMPSQTMSLSAVSLFLKIVSVRGRV